MRIRDNKTHFFPGGYYENELEIYPTNLVKRSSAIQYLKILFPRIILDDEAEYYGNDVGDVNLFSGYDEANEGSVSSCDF